ncbi:hypothetical protein [Mycolicibacterium fluoranthenivorans]|uniref:Uncharacterized protein n=1 Tax=Mycolicibacterium fluoranthenivorans TaxID=258505 RepID=A0A7X5TZQ1_9MYCO|nr:hypothetical protein [Mycolicibacterium fluoranthenivorans]MCV7358129.1 hypothetical protein [Mycolicibacterium fluoranthenivorans]NIH95751.1 hypothetical protein [Mycolicibacterium fluoranthenivorans]
MSSSTLKKIGAGDLVGWNQALCEVYERGDICLCERGGRNGEGRRSE